MKRFAATLFLAGLFFVLGVFTLSDYGINWDTPYRMLRGQAFWHYLTTGQREYGEKDRLSPILFKPDEYVTRFDFLAGEGSEPAKLPEIVRLKAEFLKKQKESGKRLTFYRDNAWNGEYFLSHDDPGHPPLPEMLGAMISNVGYERFGLIGELEAYKTVALLGATAGVAIVGIWVLEITGSALAATFACLVLATWPIFWAEAHFNFKDPVQASLVAGVMWSLWHWVKDNRLRWWGVMTLFITFSLSVKWNIVFMPAAILIWFWAIRKTAEFRRWFRPVKLFGLGLITFFVSFGFMIAIWPRSWSDPMHWIGQVAGFYRTLGISANHLQPDGWFFFHVFNLYPSILLASQTQEIVLLLIVLGIVLAIRKQDSLKTTTLILLWAGIPIARTILPWVKSYSGMRQIMEVLPPLSVLTGLGIAGLNSKLNKLKTIGLTVVVGIILLLPIIRLHPNENVYFNHFVGGIKGAAKLNLIDLMVTYGNVYKQGVEWLNANAETDAKLALVDGYMFAASPLWLREDISLSPDHFSGLEQQGEYIMLLRRPNDQTVFAQRYPERFLRPIYEIQVDGVGFLHIYKNDPNFVRENWGKEEALDQVKIRRIRSVGRDIIEMDLGETRQVTRIAVNISSGCEAHFSSPFTDELIQFIDQGSLKKNTVYGINERRKIGNTVEFWFPGESARKIDIHLQSLTSCFSQRDIIRVVALERE